MQLQNRISAPKEKKHDFEALFKRNFTRKITSAKLRKSSDKSLSQPCCSHSNTIDDAQLQKTIVLRMHPRHRATLTQPLQCVWQHHVANPHVSTHMATEHDNNHAAVTLRSATRDSRSAKKYAHTTNHSLQNTEQEPITLQTIQTATASHTRYLSSLAAAGKAKGFVLRPPLQHTSHATAMQPFTYITLRFAAPRTLPCSNYNAICIPALQNTKEVPITLETIQTATTAHTSCPSAPAAATLPKKKDKISCSDPPEHKSHATFMQLLQCDWQHHAHFHAAITMQFASRVAEHQGGTDYAMITLETIQTATAAHTRGTFHRRLQPPYPKNTRFLAPASSPTQVPCNIHAAITMRLAAPLTNPCSHYNAICIPAF